LKGAAIVNFRTFDVSTFAELTEEPNYFKKEIKQSQEMNYEELRHYISDLRQSGFDVTRLRVQWHKKFAYPMITFVMAVLAVPFAMSSSRKGGALTGVAIAIGAAVIYLVTSGLFEAMGNANQLPGSDIWICRRIPSSESAELSLFTATSCTQLSSIEVHDDLRSQEVRRSLPIHEEVLEELRSRVAHGVGNEWHLDLLPACPQIRDRRS
jgi:hypothetical protein